MTPAEIDWTMTKTLEQTQIDVDRSLQQSTDHGYSLATGVR
jgi:hypothetical protein